MPLCGLNPASGGFVQLFLNLKNQCFITEPAFRTMSLALFVCHPKMLSLYLLHGNDPCVGSSSYEWHVGLQSLWTALS